MTCWRAGVPYGLEISPVFDVAGDAAVYDEHLRLLMTKVPSGTKKQRRLLRGSLEAINGCFYFVSPRVFLAPKGRPAHVVPFSVVNAFRDHRLGSSISTWRKEVTADRRHTAHVPPYGLMEWIEILRRCFAGCGLGLCPGVVA